MAADSSVEQKLNMSLDDLVKKERTKQQRPAPANYSNGGGPQRRNDRGGPPMSDWPWRGGQGGGPQQHQQQQRMPPPGQGRQGWGQQPGRQQQHMGGGRFPNQGPPPPQQQRGSVFARLGGQEAGGQYMQQQQQQPPYPQQQFQQPYNQRGHQQQQNAGGFRPQHRHQQQHQQHQQQQQQPPQPAPRPVKPKLECYEEEAGHASLYHNGYLIMQVDPLGNVVLDSGADHSPERRAAFNIALSHFGAISVREAPQPPNAAPDAQPGWNVSEGHRLQRFADGMTIPCRGPLTANRAALLLAAYGENSGEAQAAAEAAQEASRKAAIAAGLLPDAAPGGDAEAAEAARIRRLKAQGRFMPY